MSLTEMKEAATALSPEERAELAEHLAALHEGTSVEDLRAMNAAIEEELNDPSAELSIEEARKAIDSLKLGDAA